VRRFWTNSSPGTCADGNRGRRAVAWPDARRRAARSSSHSVYDTGSRSTTSLAHESKPFPTGSANGLIEALYCGKLLHSAPKSSPWRVPCSLTVTWKIDLAAAVF
jgi:hypothetical protein